MLPEDITPTDQPQDVPPVKCISNPPDQYPSPTLQEMNSPEFQAVWGLIKTWDIAVPGWYFGYTGAMGNHVMGILNALKAIRPTTQPSDLSSKWDNEAMINGGVMFPASVTVDEFETKFFEWLESNGWGFGGTIGSYKSESDRNRA